MLCLHGQKLNDRIAHLEVTANEVAAKYKEAESRLLLRHVGVRLL